MTSKIPFKELKNNSNAPISSYETAWSSSFSARKSTDRVEIKEEPHSDEDMSLLENNISMMSVSSPKSPAFRTPARSSGIPKKAQTPGDRLLQNLKSEEDKRLLRQMYPEMFQDQEAPPPPSKGNEKKTDKSQKPMKKVIKTEPESDSDEKENVPPGFQENLEIDEKKTKTRSKKIMVSSSSDSESEEDHFQNYLKSLKTQPTEPKESKKVEKKVPKKFLVDDDEEISEEDWDSEGSEEDEEDSEYRESSPELEVIQKKTKKEKRASDDEEWFLQSLTEGFSGQIHESAKPYIKENALRQKKRREALLEHLNEIFVRRIFSEIPADKLKVTWNARLRKSAGQCRNHSNGNSTVEMSPVVCTTAERLRDTLVHELCHAAVWVVDRLHKEGHGPGWKKWGRRCSGEFATLPFVERCHNYEIEAKFFYVCENEECGQEIKRQSKSLDTQRKVCGKCRGRFELYRFCRRTNRRIKIEDPRAKDPAPKPPSPKIVQPRKYAVFAQDEKFTEFVEEHYWNYTGMKHSEVMEKLAEEFKAKELKDD